MTRVDYDQGLYRVYRAGRAHYERIKQRALSTFDLLSDAEFEDGLARMRHAADVGSTPAPVLEPTFSSFGTSRTSR